MNANLEVLFPADHPPPRETPSGEQLAAYFAGLLLEDGSMHFERSRRDEIVYASPTISYQVPNARRAARLREIAGGRLYPIPGGSIEWTVRGYAASGLGVAMKPFAPGRDTMIAAFTEWLIADSLDERVEIAESVKGQKPKKLSPGGCRLIVNNPWILAGYFDARAGYFLKLEGLRVFLNSTNRPLLSAIMALYGGDLDIHHHAGEAVTIGNRTFITKQDTWRLLFAEKAAMRLLETIGPKLQLLTLDLLPPTQW